MKQIRQILIHAKMRHLAKEECLFAVKVAQKPNKKLSTIARALKCDRRTVSRVLMRFSETELLTDQDQPGRPTALTEDQQKMLDKYITKNPTATANQLSNNSMSLWISSDETQVQLRNSGTIAWVKRGEPTPVHEISSLRAYVSLWGAVWWNGKTFARYDGYMNQTQYLHILASHLGPHVHKCRRYAVAQDRLRSHWAKPVRQWFEDCGLRLLDWPPHSPEFNAIEYVWH
ncbi:unnamed protein product [Didymodactylos carnosus]|uniref:Tc1-like transposase DDE domain-containing protein n=1 Tax=Didymodactylos carnosus TaxID=1234261 RepID=A0A814M6U2_9BILA|nr:unnamed protein product [Didymodactylos carnosus]CAF3839468.1 unnamed protein product [Didymodactylos carnosus]